MVQPLGLPLFKRRSKSDPRNYRGIQLTAQLSKAMERFIGGLLLSFLSATIAYGPNQFAYTLGRGARDAIFFWYCPGWSLSVGARR